jgi:glycosyltransferase involved in cell wall biosynthesis
MADATANNLSCLILARNEAETIAECIESAKLVNPKEILVFDDSSADDTASIAQFHGAHVIAYHKENFAQARNLALDTAEGEWILYIDADERITPQLAENINNLIKTNQYSVIGFVRQNYFLGKLWPHSEKLIRLFKKSALITWFGEVHESPHYQGTEHFVSAPLLHYTHRTLEEMVTNTLVWSGIEAQLRFDAKHPPVVSWRIVRVMLSTFFNYYITQGGWRVGTVGLIESMYQAFSMFITYARLWELQQRPSL